MKVIIELPEKDPVRTLDYFYEKCLELYILGEIENFEVSIDGRPEYKKEKKIHKKIINEYKEKIEEDNNKIMEYPLEENED